jgi:pSer/pThr/pTyr-binding forkhead associated (FHA) protein
MGHPVTIEPVSVALKFGFLAVIYLFLLWVSRSALQDLRRGTLAAAPPEDATGLQPATPPASPRTSRSPRLVVERAPGHEPGMIYDLDEGAVLGRGSKAEIRLEDPFASAGHARIFEQGNIMVIEDMASTNGTYLNEELLEGPRPLHAGDRVRIGDSEFSYEDH